MGETTDDVERTNEFLADVGAIRIRQSGRDAMLLRAGVVLMVGGLVVAVVAFFQSRNTTNVLVQNDAQILAVIGLAATVVGAALFLRYSLAAFLRFWMARLLALVAEERGPSRSG